MITGHNRTQSKLQHSICKWRVTLGRGTGCLTHQDTFIWKRKKCSHRWALLQSSITGSRSVHYCRHSSTARTAIFRENLPSIRLWERSSCKLLEFLTLIGKQEVFRLESLYHTGLYTLTVSNIKKITKFQSTLNKEMQNTKVLWLGDQTSTRPTFPSPCR